MTKPDMLADLSETMQKIRDAEKPLEAWASSFNFVLVHHAELEAMARDADRYRWMRSNHGCPFAETDDAWDGGENLDDAIDRRRHARGEQP